MIFGSKSKNVLIAILCAAALALAACTAEEGLTDPAQTEAAETTAAETESAGTEADTAPKTEDTGSETSETTPEKSETSETTPEKTEPPQTTTLEVTEATSSATAPETHPTETVPVTAAAAQQWTETPSSGVMYINTDGIYSRVEAVQGSTRVKMYSLNDAVNISAFTDTDYFKLDDGSFIHSAYLSTGKTEVTQSTSAAAAAEVTAATTTAAATTTVSSAAEPAETSESTWGQYDQRYNTQSELDFIAKTFELVNAERIKAGVPAYQHLDVLDTIASIRAWELTVEYRSDHIRPDGTICTTAFNQNGILYGAWSENVAAGQTTPEAVVDAWMNSASHRAAILSADYTHMGVGYYYSENDTQNYRHFWTLEFYRY